METFIGTITKVLGKEDGVDPDLYQVEVDIPERDKGLKAFPLRGEVDEPRVGDAVFLRELDPEYHSYYLYEKLKENSFVGIRARGKKIKITPDEIEIGVFANNDKWYDSNDGSDQTPESFAYIKVKNSGEVEVKATRLTINGQHISISGGGTLSLGTSAKVIPSAAGGPFWAGGPTAPSPGTPMVSGSIISLG